MHITLADDWYWMLLGSALVVAWAAYCIRHRPDAGGGSYLSFPLKGWVVFAVLAMPAAVLWIVIAEIVGAIDRLRARRRSTAGHV